MTRRPMPTDDEVLTRFLSEAERAVGMIMPRSVDDGHGVKYIKQIQAVRVAFDGDFDIFKMQALLMDGSVKTVAMKGNVVRASVAAAARQAVSLALSCVQ